MKGAILKKAGAKLYKNRSLLLACGSLVGLYASVVFTARAQKKADEILYERNEACNSPNDEEIMVPGKKEVFDLTWQCYIPPAISVAATTGCIIAGLYLDRKEIAALTGSVALLTANRNKIEEAIKEKYGEEGLEAIKSKLACSGDNQVEVLKVVAEETGKGDLLCYEGYSGRWFRSNEKAVEEAEKEFSRRFKDGEYLCLNDFYDILGIEESHFGFQYGWIPGEDYYDTEDGIEFTNSLIPASKTDRGEDILYIDLFTYPLDGWYEY